MKITCQSCQSKYTVSDEKVQGKTVKIKCRKCGATILVSSTGVTTTNGSGGDAADAAPTTAAGSYLVNVAEGDQRTMTLQELIDAYNTSVVTGETYVWADGMSDWQPLSQVESITSALQPAAAPAEPAAPRVAARRDPAKRSADLFSSGGEAQTAATNDVGTSSPLFKSSSPAAAKPKGEENSMLFSLSALTAKAAPAAEGAAKALNNEDSGIIDLKALTAAAESRKQTKDTSAAAASSGLGGLGGMGGMMPDEGGLFLAPPVLTAPTTAPAVVAPIEAPQKNRTPLFIGIGATLAVGAIIGAFVIMSRPEPPPPAPVTETTQAAAAPTPTQAPVAPPPTAEASAAPSASASATAVAAGSKTKSGGGGSKAPAGGGGTTAKAPAGGSTPPGGGATTAAAPVKKPGTCNCPPGDLMCAMKCSTN